MTAGTGDATIEHDPLAAVQAWRARHAAGADPVRLHVAEALARRAAAQQGATRERLLGRLAQLLAEIPPAPAPAGPMSGTSEALAGLTALVDRLGRAPGTVAPPLASASQRPALPRAPRPAALKAVEAFKGTWSRLRAEQRLRQALAKIPARAGPLHSSHLVHGALRAMHELSPAYLEAFMAHVDTLLWLEQASGAGDLAPRARRKA